MQATPYRPEDLQGMSAYTRWWIAHPWHITGTAESGKVPADCDCTYCERRRKGVSMTFAVFGKKRWGLARWR